MARLFAPPDDVEALKTVLSDAEVGAFDSVAILIDQLLLPVRLAILKFCANSAPDDLILLYYTGHGVLTFHNDLYLAVHETTIDSSDANGLGAAWVRDRLEQSRARRQVLILDCCHSGAFVEGRKDAGVRAVTTETFGHGHGRYILTASDAQSFAWDASALKEGPRGMEGRTSLFTRLLVQGLETGAAAPDKDTITVQDLYAYVYKNLPPDAPAMSPQIFVDCGVGELVLARNPSRLRPKQLEAPDLAIFRDVDAPWCPEMVALPAGTFLMGSPKDERERDGDEGPQHCVTIGYRFAIGRYPVTFEQYDHFCDATKREKPRDERWGHGRRPAINVSWYDAQAYVEWLAKKIGQPYRLPSEAEWEYACRAGTTTRYAFGDVMSEQDANYNIGKTTEVGVYPPNLWGLYDMHGNVWEWVEDVWHGSYVGAPAGGAAWTYGKGKESSRARVLRGGSWNGITRNCRSANRYGDQPDSRGNNGGFRVARALP